MGQALPRFLRLSTAAEPNNLIEGVARGPKEDM